VTGKAGRQNLCFHPFNHNPTPTPRNPATLTARSWYSFMKLRKIRNPSRHAAPMLPLMVCWWMSRLSAVERAGERAALSQPLATNACTAERQHAQIVKAQPPSTTHKRSKYAGDVILVGFTRRQVEGLQVLRAILLHRPHRLHTLASPPRLTAVCTQPALPL